MMSRMAYILRNLAAMLGEKRQITVHKPLYKMFLTECISNFFFLSYHIQMLLNCRVLRRDFLYGAQK